MREEREQEHLGVCSHCLKDAVAGMKAFDAYIGVADQRMPGQLDVEELDPVVRTDFEGQEAVLDQARGRERVGGGMRIDQSCSRAQERIGLRAFGAEGVGQDAGDLAKFGASGTMRIWPIQRIGCGPCASVVSIWPGCRSSIARGPEGVWR